jgi:hypothetical protein
VILQCIQSTRDRCIPFGYEESQSMSFVHLSMK